MEQARTLSGGPLGARHQVQALRLQPLPAPELLGGDPGRPGPGESSGALRVEAPSAATIVCQGDTFTFKLDQAPADNGGIFLVIEATEGKSNGVSRAHASAAAIKLVEEPTAAAVDIRADYVAKNGAPSAAAPKIFFRYYLVDSSTGVKSQVVLAETKWVAAANEDPGEGDWSSRSA